MKIKEGKNIILDTCPRCNSLNITAKKVHEQISHLGGYNLYTSRMINRYKCNNCNEKWNN